MYNTLTLQIRGGTIMIDAMVIGRSRQGQRPFYVIKVPRLLSSARRGAQRDSAGGGRASL